MGLILLSGSCMEGDIDFTQYDEYSTVFSFNHDGLLSVDYNNVGRDVEVKVIGEDKEELLRIHKGGTDPSRSVAAQLVLMTQEELDAYNEENGSAYQFLPEEYYTMPKEVTIGSNEDGCPISIVLKASLGENEEAQKNQYIIPIKLMSETAKVNNNRNRLIIRPNVITPSVSLDAIGLQTVNMYDYPTAAKEVIYETGLALDCFNEWNFSVKLINDQNKLEELVEIYNVNNGTNYSILPAENYAMPSTIEFSSNESSKGFSVTLKNANLTVGGYLLPVVLDKVEGIPFNVSEHVLYIRLNVTKTLPRLIFSKDLASTNSTSPWTTSEGANAAFDGSVSTFWQNQWSAWEVTEPVNDPVYGFYLDVNLSTTDIKLKTMLNFVAKVRGWSRTTLPYTIRLYGGTNKDDLSPISEELPIRVVESPEKQTVFENPTAVSLPESGITYLRFAVLESIDKDKNQIHKLTEKKNTDGSWSWKSVCITELEYYGL